MLRTCCLGLLLLFLVAGAQESHQADRKSYDDIYSKGGVFSTAPNAFMVRAVTGRPPGRALDVGMGQGRNALWLAEHGWAVTGFDISPVGIEQARAQATRRGLRLDASVTAVEDFELGRNQWDLIVFAYFFPRSALPKIWEALKPGGLVVAEGFHQDTARVRPLTGGFHDNELAQIFSNYRILIYEDAEDRQDWGLPFGDTNRLVRILAQKPAPVPPGCTWEEKRYEAGQLMCWGITRWTCGVKGWEPAGRCPQ